jgi:antirestriction protein ArdC
MKKDVYDRITATIVADLEQGVRPWMKPWAGGAAVSRPLRANGAAYRGINTLVLWSAAMEKGYRAPIWMTFKQALELNAYVRKGEQGCGVVYASTFSRTETDADTGEATERDIPFLKGYTVFNVEQIEGLPAHYTPAPPAPVNPETRIASAEAFFTATGATIRHGGDRAFYAPSLDLIQMPDFESFRDAETYYATLAHETVHWTSHARRLNRDFGRARFGDQGYAMEELVAELGSAFLSADLSLTPEVREDHASYIASWITVLKSDRRAIFTAAAHAQRAADFLNAFQPCANEAAA